MRPSPLFPALLAALALPATAQTPSPSRAPIQAPASAAPVAAPFRMAPIVLTEPGPGGVRVDEAGVFGNYFAPPPGFVGCRPAILVLGGSEGGLGGGGTREARLLAAHGFAVLQLAYFGAPGLPATLKIVPLETFDRGLAWLRARPEVDPERTAVVGTSKGAEAALLIAAHDAALMAVVAASPSSVVWPGIDFTGGIASSWSRGGRPAPYLPYGKPAVGKQGLASIYAGYADAFAARARTPDAAIAVERSHAAIMLVCGGADTLWPSCAMSEAAAARAAKAGGRPVRLLRYPDAGHASFGPPVSPTSPGFAGLAGLGGTAEANNAARQDAWPKALAFLDAAFAR